MEIFSSYDLQLYEWLLVILCGMLIGMSKTGLSGAGLFVVPVFAGIFGGKPSAGLVLPMLIVADFFAVKYYHRHAEWKYVLKLLPWAFAGIVIALLVGNAINDEQFRILIAILVIMGIGLMIFQDVRRNKMSVPDYWWFSALLGLTGGFATMIGNAAGPVMSLYLLSMRLPKNIFIGTGAWFFLIVNLVKFPLHIFFWKTITLQSLNLNLLMVIPIITGAISGFYIVKLFPEKAYRLFIIVSTLASAAALF
ncbi:MAG: sulfite exporter TauE/SafE family protein [Bacteroidales bacterium]|nr:sulfite exporter TauE/SafE family protein [Bacteroidales bacterium]